MRKKVMVVYTGYILVYIGVQLPQLCFTPAHLTAATSASACCYIHSFRYFEQS
jgi:hypothetical protein